MANPSASSRVGEPVSLLRRLGSMLYDGLLLVAAWMLLGLLYAVLIPDGHASVRILQLMQLLMAWGFLVFFWTRAGQTLGMRAWHIRLRQGDGAPIRLGRATLRFLVALAQWLFLLLGIFLARQHGTLVTVAVTAVTLLSLGLSQLHPQRWMLHDWLSGTFLEME